MRKAVVYGLAVVCVCLLFALSGPLAQRTIVGGDDGGPGTTAVPVTVANFPQVQPVQVDKTVNVTGSVAVINLPAVQQVAGTVNVGNLPLNQDGNLRVTGTLASLPAAASFVGFTSPAPLSVLTALQGSRLCSQEIPGSRLCSIAECYRSIPAPPEFPTQMLGTGWARLMEAEIPPHSAPALICIRSDGEVEASACTLITGLTETPFACCGY